jgi:NAD-dependent dihydropyrimidine dehydrogenase PreA subunit
MRGAVKMPKVTIDYKKCTTKKTCIDVCPVGVFELKGKKVVVAHEDQCIGCHACEASCPENAITVVD